MKQKICLVKDTIDKEDIDSLIEWLKTYPKLTQGELTKSFEEKWSLWNNSKYSVYVNSGSSANLATIFALKLSNRMKNNKVVTSAVSWATTVSPLIQLGMNPILCEVDKKTLGIDVECFRKICKKEKPAALFLVHILGTPCDLDEIINICNEYEVMLVEDSCEGTGSTYKNKKLGTFGLIGTYSFYYGHHISTIEGGMICTDDRKFYNILKSIRAHGWDRDLDDDEKYALRKKYQVDDFKALYTFYHPGFNLRSTDLQAFIGLRQLEKINEICKKRNENLKTYDKLIKNDYWKLDISNKNIFYSNFAYPIINPKIKELVKNLKESNVETRPLVCGSIKRQPFWIEWKKSKEEKNNNLKLFSDDVHDYGLYLPNNHQLTKEEIEFVSKVVNESLEK